LGRRQRGAEVAALFYGNPATTPSKASSPLAASGPVSPDPFFAVLGRYQAARIAWDAYSRRIACEGWDALGGIAAASDAEARLGNACYDISAEVLGTVPTTEAGRLALASFIETWVANQGNADGSPQDGSATVFAEVYPALLKALRASVTGKAA